LRGELPDSIGNLLWFAYGPADTSCFIPLYAGVTDLPASWNHPANFTRIDRQQAQWNFRLINSLVQRLPYQPAIKEVCAMIKPAERHYLDLQPVLEQAAAEILRRHGRKAAESFLTAYSAECAQQVGFAYAQLVDYLMLRFLAGAPEFAPPELPRIVRPTIPDRASAESGR
jgi:dipeptidase